MTHTFRSRVAAAGLFLFLGTALPAQDAQERFEALHGVQIRGFDMSVRFFRSGDPEDPTVIFDRFRFQAAGYAFDMSRTRGPAEYDLSLEGNQVVVNPGGDASPVTLGTVTVPAAASIEPGEGVYVPLEFSPQAFIPRAAQRSGIPYPGSLDGRFGILRRQTQKVWVSFDDEHEVYFEQIRWQRRQEGEWVDGSRSRMNEVSIVTR